VRQVADLDKFKAHTGRRQWFQGFGDFAGERVLAKAADEDGDFGCHE
jgi:hypothetical protein